MMVGLLSLVSTLLLLFSVLSKILVTSASIDAYCGTNYFQAQSDCKLECIDGDDSECSEKLGPEYKCFMFTGCTDKAASTLLRASENNNTVTTSGGTGNSGCSCINTTDTLLQVQGRECTLQDGSRGVYAGSDRMCVEPSYGSSFCMQHDLISDPDCSITENDLATHAIPQYCSRSWCYVDVIQCKKESLEIIFRSSYFDVDTNVDLFFSYSTCNSTAEDFIEAQDTIVFSQALGGIDILANVPNYYNPSMFKRNGDGGIITSTNDAGGEEYYYNDAMPWEGAAIEYVQEIVQLSGGDIRVLNITHRSKGSNVLHPTSSFTAAVQDVANGLADMSIGPFWVTAERMKMSAFTLPLGYDRTFLVIPKPGSVNFLSVFSPFSWGLWILILGIITTAAALSTWFTGSNELRSERRNGRFSQPAVQNSKARLMKTYCRLFMDSFLKKGIWFCSAGIEQDLGMSLPNRTLFFGFGFFILIIVSAYVANLAAFLTSNSANSVSTMKEAIAAGYTICAHPAVKSDLEIAWPNANFYYHNEGFEVQGIINDYLAGKCQVMVIGYDNPIMDGTLMNQLCDNDLVYTDSMAVQVRIAMPIRSELVQGFSYWMRTGEKLGLTYDIVAEKFKPTIKCNVNNGEVVNEMASLGVKHMIFPTMFFVCFALIASILQLKHQRNLKRGRKSALGRASTVLKSNIFESNMNTGIELNKNMANCNIDDEPQASKSDQWMNNPAIGEITKNDSDLNLDSSLDIEERRIFGIVDGETEQGITRKEN